MANLTENRSTAELHVGSIRYSYEATAKTQIYRGALTALDADGNAVAEKEMHTAGKPYRIVLEADRNEIKADGKDLSFVTVKVVDKAGNLCPMAENEISFKVKGAGSYCAGANGNPASLESFQEPHMKVFSGMMTAIVSSSEEPGTIVLEATSKGLKKASVVISTAL